MTCIIGLVQDCKVWMGGDSMAASGWNMRVAKNRKVFLDRGYLTGYTSSFRMGQLLEHEFCPPILSPGMFEEEDMLGVMVRSYVPKLRELFKSAGYTKIENNQESGGVFLVGFGGRLFSIDSDFHVAETMENYQAIGAGESYALGAMAALDDSMKPQERILRALEISGMFCNGVCGPYYVLNEDGTVFR